ncbi:MAG: hypothetical protein ACE5F1_10625 [Planctomycetota bacterium]
MEPTKTRRNVLGLLFVLFVAWRGSASTIDLAQEVFRTGPDEIIQALTLSQEERIHKEFEKVAVENGLPSGRESELYRALRDHVAKDGLVVFLSRISPESMITYSHMELLFFPSRYLFLEELPQAWEKMLVKSNVECNFVEYDRPAIGPLDAKCKLLASGNGFRLLRYRGTDK